MADESHGEAASDDVDEGGAESEQEEDELPGFAASAARAREFQAKAKDLHSIGLAVTDASADSAASAAAANDAPERVKTRGNRGAAPPVTPQDGGPILGPAELQAYGNPQRLLAEVSSEDIKRSLQHWGMKCGGEPLERASRLFMLKLTAPADLPKSVLAPKPKPKK